METIVIKFGGSSVADNSKLQLVANKVIKLYDEDNNVVVVVSAQGKKTDQLIKEAEELSQSLTGNPIKERTSLANPFSAKIIWKNNMTEETGSTNGNTNTDLKNSNPFNFWYSSDAIKNEKTMIKGTDTKINFNVFHAANLKVWLDIIST